MCFKKNDPKMEIHLFQQFNFQKMIHKSTRPLGVFLAAASRGWAGWTPPPPPPLPPSPPVAGHGWPKMGGGKFGQNQGKRRKDGHTWGP